MTFSVGSFERTGKYAVVCVKFLVDLSVIVSAAVVADVVVTSLIRVVVTRVVDGSLSVFSVVGLLLLAVVVSKTARVL